MKSYNFYDDRDAETAFQTHVSSGGHQCHFCTFVLFSDAYNAMFEWELSLMSRGYHSVAPLYKLP